AHAAAADPDDVARLHPGRGAAGSELRGRRRDAPVARHCGVLRHARRDFLRLGFYASILCDQHRSLGTAFPLAQARGAGGVHARRILTMRTLRTIAATVALGAFAWWVGAPLVKAESTRL